MYALGLSYKTPTSLLTKGTHKQEFVAFGYEAEERFADQDEDDACQMNLFKKFKMILRQEEVCYYAMFKTH